MTRKRYVVRLEPQEPLLLGMFQTSGNYRESASVIAGRTWRGALAMALKQEHRALFDRLFPDSGEQAHFGPLFPGLSDKTAPYPPTAFSCKYHPGFPTAEHPDRHGIFDVLARQYALDIAIEKDPLPARIDEVHCPQCGAPAEPYRGYEARIERSSTTHVAINRTRRVAEDTLLYVCEGVELVQETEGAAPKPYFIGWVDVPESLVQPLSEALNAGRLLHIGANRSRGMGLAVVAGFKELERAGQPELEARVRTLNAALSESLAPYEPQTHAEAEAAANGLFFTLDLRSEAILLRDGLPARDPDLPPGVQVARRWLEWRTTGGWHVAVGLPRRSQAAVMGTYLCRFESSPNYSALADLEREGIGEMREQGFGQLSVCTPFHLKNGLDDKDLAHE